MIATSLQRTIKRTQKAIFPRIRFTLPGKSLLSPFRSTLPGKCNVFAVRDRERGGVEPGSEPNTRMDLYNESPSNPNQNVVCCKESTSVHALPSVDARKSASSPRNGEKGRAALLPARRSPQTRGLGRDSRSGHFPRFVSRTTRFTPPVRQHCLAASLDWISETAAVATFAKVHVSSMARAWGGEKLVPLNESQTH